jgi:SnoaL-like domain
MTATSDDRRLHHMLERDEIFDLVRVERFYRDQRDWGGLLASYVPHAPVRTTWFDGTIEDFVDASRRKMSGPGASAAKHWIFPTALQINDDRALIESPAAIFDRLTFDNVEFDSFQYCRFVSRLVRIAAGWRLASFEGIYQRDHLRSVNPSEPLPVDWKVIATLRPSYKFLAYTQLRRGYKVDPELLGDDRPDLLAAFYERERRWLASGP